MTTILLEHMGTAFLDEGNIPPRHATTLAQREATALRSLSAPHSVCLQIRNLDASNPWGQVVQRERSEKHARMPGNTPVCYPSPSCHRFEPSHAPSSPFA
jgi:hypothetical protein